MASMPEEEYAALVEYANRVLAQRWADERAREEWRDRTLALIAWYQAKGRNPPAFDTYLPHYLKRGKPAAADQAETRKRIREAGEKKRAEKAAAAAAAAKE